MEGGCLVVMLYPMFFFDVISKKYTWYFGDNTTATGNPVQHIYNTTGFYKVKLVGEDFAGKKDSITKQLKIDWPTFDPVRNKIICGIDTVTFEERDGQTLVLDFDPAQTAAPALIARIAAGSRGTPRPPLPSSSRWQRDSVNMHAIESKIRGSESSAGTALVFSCTEAYLVKDGKIGAPVKGATLIGDGPTVLTKVTGIGNDMALDEGVGVCGKGGQSVPAGVGQPTLLVEGLTVGGTA